MQEYFKNYFDNSPDSDTIMLELSVCDDFISFLSFIAACQVPSLTQELFNIIRYVWDAAYSHGEHDALAEVGATLKEMED